MRHLSISNMNSLLQLSMLNINTLPDNKDNLNIRHTILDPLSVIIKLAILAYKPIGTKLLIHMNVVYFQEPGLFQAICRSYYHTNKTDLQYLYNPIQLACERFLSMKFVEKNPQIVQLFHCSQMGLERLMETYKHCTMITLALNYYYIIISNHIDKIYNDAIFRKDAITLLYNSELVETLHSQWTSDKIKLILDLVGYLVKDSIAHSNVKSLENLMDNVDNYTRCILEKI